MGKSLLFLVSFLPVCLLFYKKINEKIGYNISSLIKKECQQVREWILFQWSWFRPIKAQVPLFPHSRPYCVKGNYFTFQFIFKFLKGITIMRPLFPLEKSLHNLRWNHVTCVEDFQRCHWESRQIYYNFRILLPLICAIDSFYPMWYIMRVFNMQK